MPFIHAHPSSADPTRCVLFEFKPKWLNQSPSAPAGAIRCRQCAMELYNFIRDPKLTRSTPNSKPCPMVLDNAAAPMEINSPYRIAPELAKANRPMLAASIAAAANHRVIADLRKVQALADPNGPLKAVRDDPMFNFAMTIRDCTCFVQIYPDKKHPGPEGPLRLRLGDFDSKDTTLKFDRWQEAERSLISSGCYTADWILCDGKYYHPPTACFLEWAPRPADQPLRVMHVLDTTRPEQAALRVLTKPFETAGLLYNLRTDAATLKVMLQRFSKDNPKVNVCPYRPQPL